MSDADDTTKLAEGLPGWMRWFILLVPPHDSSPKRQYLWRVRMWMTTCAAFVMAVGIWGVSLGWPPQLFDGYVKKSEFSAGIESMKKAVNNAKNEDHARWASQLDIQILDMRRNQCKAIQNKNNEAAALYRDKIQMMMGEYQQLTGQVYGLPNCGEI